MAVWAWRGVKQAEKTKGREAYEAERAGESRSAEAVHPVATCLTPALWLDFTLRLILLVLQVPSFDFMRLLGLGSQSRREVRIDANSHYVAVAVLPRGYKVPSPEKT